MAGVLFLLAPVDRAQLTQTELMTRADGALSSLTGGPTYDVLGVAAQVVGAYASERIIVARTGLTTQPQPAEYLDEADLLAMNWLPLDKAGHQRLVDTQRRSSFTADFTPSMLLPRALRGYIPTLRLMKRLRDAREEFGLWGISSTLRR
jgi:hypothetical protein